MFAAKERSRRVEKWMLEGLGVGSVRDAEVDITRLQRLQTMQVEVQERLESRRPTSSSREAG